MDDMKVGNKELGGPHVRMVPSAFAALITAARALDQCVDDFGLFPDGKCVCQQAKDEAIAALAGLKAVGIDIDDEALPHA